jgi:hypothetical protein
MRGVVVCALALAAAACGGGNDTSSSSKKSDSSPTTTTAPVVPVALPDACPTIHGTTTIAQSSGPRPPGLLTDADAGVEGCLDRVTFTFESLGDGTPPGYRVAYEDPPFTDGDPPEEIAVDGSAFLSVTITPAASVDTRVEDQPPTYLGGLLLEYGDHHHLVEVRKLDDALGSVRWIIALDGRRPFLVDSAVDPTRISVYIG